MYLHLNITTMNAYDRNTYFFLTLPEPALNAILAHCVEKTVDNVGKLYDGSYLVKLPMDAPIPSVLQNKTPYTHAEMIIERNKREAGRPPI